MSNRATRGVTAATAPRTPITAYGCGPAEAALFRNLAPRFGVTATITAAAVSEANVDLARGKRCISVGHQTPVPAATLRALSRAGVAYISTRSIGCNHIDVAYAESLGIDVETVAYSPDSVADYTLMLVLMALRGARSIVSRSNAFDYRQHEAPGKELRDLTVGVIGTGRIGAAVIRRLTGFGCLILAHDSRPSTEASYVTLDELIRQSDVVTLHTPLDTSTRHLLNRRRIADLKPGAVVVNTGRGGLIDTPALTSALESGHLGAAALDVLEGEDGIFYADCRNRPLQHDLLTRLQRLPNVFISPHTAYFTDHALRDAAWNSIANCLDFERRKQPAWTS
jgi:D-specific alpha-keto acid dehydrogenase